MGTAPLCVSTEATSTVSTQGNCARNTIVPETDVSPQVPSRDKAPDGGRLTTHTHAQMKTFFFSLQGTKKTNKKKTKKESGWARRNGRRDTLFSKLHGLGCTGPLRRPVSYHDARRHRHF